MRKLGSKGRLAILGIVLVLGITCCQFRGSWSARLIDNVLGKQPGVTFVAHTVSSNNGFGVRTASFDVYVSADATADQLSALTRTFASQIHESMVYGGLGADLNVRRSPQSFPGQTDSTMYVSFRPSSPTPEAPWQDWLKLSKGDYAYGITGWAAPDHDGRPAHTSVTVTLRRFADRRDHLSASEFAASVRRLATDFPNSTVGWSVSDIDTNSAPSIRSDPGLPNPAQLALWEALDQIAPVDGEFNMNPPDRNRFSIKDMPADPDVDRVVVGQLQLIKNSGMPAVYKVEDAQITVRPGSCSMDVQEPQPRTPPVVDLQTRLRAQFESCPR
ncbi:hypothetical protein M2272_005517 [Mycobacterium frederiksbergense]|uniref:Uncharacterized protein n=1 Tax=Mycolicibacterium frederiksbergense TaxID=117567 RepID=A0ABT6L9G5_9MYCO|nr:hypothetical protein [Mycolicibacterium frederiksbergense]MDH6198857.1 hypothetical protein [Mycolicibacterium frederiksbergense]